MPHIDPISTGIEIATAAGNETWFTQWWLSAIFRQHPHVVETLQHVMPHVGQAMFGAYFLVDLYFLRQELQKKHRDNCDGTLTEEKRLTGQAGLTTLHMGLIPAAGYGFFGLHAAWAPPLFFAMFGVMLVKNIKTLYEDVNHFKGYLEKVREYEADSTEHRGGTRNPITFRQALLGGSYYDKEVEDYQPSLEPGDSETGPSKDQVIKAQLQSYRTKIRHQATMTVLTGLGLAFACTFLVNPLIAVGGMAITILIMLVLGPVLSYFKNKALAQAREIHPDLIGPDEATIENPAGTKKEPNKFCLFGGSGVPETESSDDADDDAELIGSIH